jgi:hypothetical protein
MHEDGLWELFLGSLLLVLGVSAFIEGDTWRLVAHLGLTVGLIVLIKVAKRTISVPRMGVAKFGPGRREKRRKTKLLLLFSSLLGVALFLAVVSVSVASTWMRSNVGLINVFVGVWAFVVFGGMAYWLDLPRMLLAGIVYALVFSHLLPVSTGTTAFVGGAVLAIPGLGMFIRFLRKYPLPAEAEAHGNG